MRRSGGRISKRSTVGAGSPDAISYSKVYAPKVKISSKKQIPEERPDETGEDEDIKRD